MKAKNLTLFLITIFSVYFSSNGKCQTTSDFIIKRDPEKNIGALYKIKGHHNEITKKVVLVMGEDRDCEDCENFLRNFSMALDTVRAQEFLSSDYKNFENDTIDYILEVNNIIISGDFYQSRVADHSYESGYAAKLFFDINLKNINGELLQSTKLKTRNPYTVGGTHHYFPSLENALRAVVFEADLWERKLNDSIYKILPPTSLITKADEINKNNEVTLVTIEGGVDIGVALRKDISTNHFNVYDGLQSSDKLIGDLKIKSVEATSTKCKVVSGGDLIAKALKEGKKLLVVEKME